MSPGNISGGYTKDTIPGLEPVFEVEQSEKAVSLGV